MSIRCYIDSGSYHGRPHTVGYLTVTRVCVCVERVPLVIQTFVATRRVLTLLVTFTKACVGVERVSFVTDSISYQGSSHTVGYLTFTSGRVCVGRVPLFTQTAVATRGVLTLLVTLPSHVAVPALKEYPLLYRQR